jgi:hypothetical protein
LWNQPENPGKNGGNLQENEKNMQKQKNAFQADGKCGIIIQLN